METAQKTVITIENTINAPVEKVWEYWNGPKHIEQWCTATPEWETVNAKNDLKPGGTISSRMQAKDGSMGFDFGGTYDVVTTNEYIQYTMGDGRQVKTSFTDEGAKTKVVESFHAEDMNPIEMQRAGWQAILDNFKKYTESH
ncbi:MAG: SRPBCC family protein [Agriterribacter sp.]